MQSKNSIRSNLAFVDRMTIVQLNDPNDPEFIKELYEELISFQDNNNQTLIKSKAFYKLNRELVYQALSNEPHRQSYFSSDQGGKTGVMPKHNEDFSNAEQKEKNKFMGIRI